MKISNEKQQQNKHLIRSRNEEAIRIIKSNFQKSPYLCCLNGCLPTELPTQFLNAFSKQDTLINTKAKDTIAKKYNKPLKLQSLAEHKIAIMVKKLN